MHRLLDGKSALLSLLLASIVTGIGVAEAFVTDSDTVSEVCQRIAQSISSASSVHRPGGDPIYAQDISHYSASSSEPAACSVEPGSAHDVGTILQDLGNTHTPFAVKGGGHAMNPNYSSTLGVQIAMYQFNEIVYDPETHTVDVGAGHVWDDVYAALQPYNVSVVGGRVPGIGVAGFTLGGGYSWKTNQYGLALDNVVAFEIVLPNGTVESVTQHLHPDLFWGLKGGFNNFGIVTKFTLKTYPQVLDVWGGVITIVQDLDALNSAIVRFTNTVTDPKAAIIPSYFFSAGQIGISMLMFYDNPMPPVGVFDDLLAIPYVSKDLKTRPLVDLVQASPSNVNAGFRGVYHTVSHLQYTLPIIEAFQNETQFWGEHFSGVQGMRGVSYSIEPFLPSILSHAPEDSSAYPSSRAAAFFPLSISVAYTEESLDEEIYEAMRQSAEQLKRVAVSEGQDLSDVSLYGNYAMFGTPVERIYGRRNLERLRALRRKYDPRNVMGLAGGWKL